MSTTPSNAGTPAAPLFRKPGEGVIHQVAMHENRCILSAEATGGVFSLFEIVCPPKEGVPFHTHTLEDETFIGVEGEIELVVGEAKYELTPGAVAFGPRGVQHCFHNPTDRPSRFYIIATPGGLERFFGECHERLPRSQPFDPALFVEIIRKHGMIVADHP